MFKKILILTCVLGITIFFITNCETYTKAEVDDMISKLDDDLSDQQQPVAYGTINSTGAISGGSGNFTVDHTASTGVYTITITGVSSFYANYNVNIGLLAAAAGYTTWDTLSDNLIIRTFNSSGVLTDRYFSFSVWKN